MHTHLAPSRSAFSTSQCHVALTGPKYHDCNIGALQSISRANEAVAVTCCCRHLVTRKDWSDALLGRVNYRSDVYWQSGIMAESAFPAIGEKRCCISHPQRRSLPTWRSAAGYWLRRWTLNSCTLRSLKIEGWMRGKEAAHAEKDMLLEAVSGRLGIISSCFSVCPSSVPASPALASATPVKR